MLTHDSFLVVDRIFKDAGLHPIKLLVGKIALSASPSKSLIKQLNSLLLPLGYSIIDNNSEKIASRIKISLAELLLNKELTLKTNFSVYLSDNLHYEYHYLSTVFSDFEGISIEKYFIKLKIEKAKELIAEGKLTFGEIAYQLAYSSPAHFTNQFKQTEGLSPSYYKLSNKKNKL